MKWLFVVVIALGLAGCKKKDGCTKDTDCKGKRVCEASKCREPKKPKPRPRPKQLFKVVGKKRGYVVKITVKKIKTDKKKPNEPPLVTLEFSAPPVVMEKTLPVGYKVYVEGSPFFKQERGKPQGAVEYVAIDMIHSDVIPSSKAVLVGIYGKMFVPRNAGNEYSDIKTIQVAGRKAWEKATEAYRYRNWSTICGGPVKVGKTWRVKATPFGTFACE